MTAPVQGGAVEVTKMMARHGDMLPAQLFGARPHARFHAYRGPLPGLFMSGSGVWPGGYVTGVPGRNTSAAVLADLLEATS